VTIPHAEREDYTLNSVSLSRLAPGLATRSQFKVKVKNQSSIRIQTSLSTPIGYLGTTAVQRPRAGYRAGVRTWWFFPSWSVDFRVSRF